MKYEILWLEKEKYGIKVSAKKEDGHKIDAYLGKEFTDVMSGHTIEATTWTSPKNGKIYLFKAKEETKKPMGNAGFIAKAQETKREDIKHSQDRKEESIKTASILRDSTLLTIAQVGKDGATKEIMEEIFEQWKKYLTGKWEEAF